MMQGLTQIKNVNIVCVASDDARTYTNQKCKHCI